MDNVKRKSYFKCKGTCFKHLENCIRQVGLIDDIKKQQIQQECDFTEGVWLYKLLDDTFHKCFRKNRHFLVKTKKE